jgi:hypothetical protein
MEKQRAYRDRCTQVLSALGLHRKMGPALLPKQPLQLEPGRLPSANSFLFSHSFISAISSLSSILHPCGSENVRVVTQYIFECDLHKTSSRANVPALPQRSTTSCSFCIPSLQYSWFRPRPRPCSAHCLPKD